MRELDSELRSETWLSPQIWQGAFAQTKEHWLDEYVSAFELPHVQVFGRTFFLSCARLRTMSFEVVHIVHL